MKPPTTKAVISNAMTPSTVENLKQTEKEKN